MKDKKTDTLDDLITAAVPAVVAKEAAKFLAQDTAGKSTISEKKQRIREMAAEIGEKKQEIAFLRVVYKQLGLVYDGVKKLELHVRGCIHLGYYRFVIRTIPEKKIQKGIESENAEDFEAVLVMVLAIVDKIMTRVNKDSTRKRLFDETMAELMDTGILNNEEAAAASATDSILQDIFKDVEIDIPANATLPVEDSEANNEIQA